MSTATLERAPESAAPRSVALRGFSAIFLAGGVAGLLVGGLGSRVAMRVAAVTAREGAQGLTTEAGATIGRITLEGTVFLVLLAGIGSALVGTAFYLATLPWLPRHRRVRALAFGGLELAVFGTTLLDAGNPDFTILARPLLDVLMLGSLFVLHGVVLVLLVEPSRHFVSWVARGARWRARLVEVGTFLAMAATALGVVGLVARASGLSAVVLIVLLACAIGLALVDPRRARPITRPAFRVVGAAALVIVAVSGTLALVDEVAAIV
ncbi:MAG: hypothetical protein WB297_01755 [Actinomycetota bacterium]